ncbi:RING finger protein 17 isoform X5 [Plutella xylostella]|uniref:RING finger protein 17 isoform X4 n=1 Tax=Plutella xylostella TaxID=51655 RepID=UPI002032589A|nr:RING finger protein 17 isoform X4 [Plutella xylostella]XP_048477588.1 RING finger protein 17 isoform X5 [Plutella xylostella]
MDARVRKSCPNCSQCFSLKSQQQKGRVPLLLQCGHSVCEVCIRNMVKFTEPINCKVCGRDMELSQSDQMLCQADLHAVFPVNIYTLGEIVLNMEGYNSPSTQDSSCYIDLKELLNSVDHAKSNCIECRGSTSKMCQQCVTVMCEGCFTKTHKFHVFKSHVLKDIALDVEPSNCKVHKVKSLDYYCKDCSKLLCMDCMIVGGEKSCKNHTVISAEELNEGAYEELNEICPKVDETFRRLTKTAVDIGNLLNTTETGLGDSQLNKTKIQIQHHFSKLHASIQKHEEEIMTIMDKLVLSEKQSLQKAKTSVADNIKKAKTVLNKMNTVLNPEKETKGNVIALLEEAKEVINTPWFLNKDEDNTSPLKVAVNEDLCALISDYVHLEGNANSVYKLKRTPEIGEGVEVPPAPPKPVFPPDMFKDVREMYKKDAPKPKQPEQSYFANVPRYRSKSGSTSSINSINSDSSNKEKRFPSGAGGGQTYAPRVHTVSPFTETNSPKQLFEGSQELIYISHIIAPDDLYVQRACHQRLVREMLREFRNAVSWPRPSAAHVAEGKIYLAFNKALKEWQRCRVVNIDRRDVNKPICYVFCIDFGSTEAVTLDNLRLLPAARLQSPPPLAMHCALANCAPRAGAWAAEDSVLIQKIIDNKQAVIHVRRIISPSNYSVTLECDVTTFEDGVSLAHALVFHERARMPNPRLHYPKINGLMERPKIFFGTTDYKSKAVEEVFITYVVSPDKFYVRKTHLQPTYEKLFEELEEEYSLSVTAGTVYCPQEGMVCVVNMDKYVNTTGSGGGWRRCVVEATPGRLRARVLCVDTGELALVHYSALRAVREHHTRLKALAVECHLSGVTPLNKKWSPGSVSLLESFQHRPIELHVEETRGKSVGVTLYEKSDPDDVVCVNTLMIKHKFAVTIGVFMFNKNLSPESQSFTKTPLDKVDNPRPKKKPEKEILKRGEPTVSPTKKIKDNDLHAKDKGPIKLEVKILSCHSPSLVYVSLIDQQKTLKELFDTIQDYYSKNKLPSKDEWQVGDRCCTVCLESKTWRRAVIIELQGTSAKVFYSDFACVETVPISQLRELVPEFQGIGDAAIKCHLSGVIPAVGEEWPTLTKEYLNELVEAYQRIFITKNGSIKNKSLPVELWVYHVIQGGALEPNKAEWRCLNRNIIEQGLGVPDKTQQDEASKEKDKDKDSDDMIKFLGVTGSVQEWLQLEPPATEALITAAPARSQSESDDDDAGPLDQSGQSTSKTVLVSDWLPAEPLSAQQFTGVPTYVDNEGLIYLHDVSQQDTLDLIRKALDVRFRTSRPPRARPAAWAPGQPCAARFYLDQQFYRGRVLAADADACLVHYVDYGNDERCAAADLRRTLVLHRVPVQAARCRLARVAPRAAVWDKTTLDYLHKSIVEKQCLIKVAGEPVDGVIPVDIKIDKVYINDLLVELEMAYYTDGTQPVVPKYAPAAPPSAAETDSGPDYLVDEDSDEPASEPDPDRSADLDHSTDLDPAGDWARLVEDEDAAEEYPGARVGDQFPCHVAFMTDQHVELVAAPSPEQQRQHDELAAALQRAAPGAPVLRPPLPEHRPCLALFPADARWYRAAVQECSPARRLARVRYVDFGNSEVVPLEHVRALPAALARAPPAALRARLHRVAARPARDPAELQRRYEETFPTDASVHATVVAVDGHDASVELRDDHGNLVYENLIKEGIFRLTDEDEPTD